MEPSDLESAMQATVVRYALFAPGQTVVVGVSGGPDSTALLHALAARRDEWKLALVAAHLHHGFRGAEADADADYVAELSACLNVPCRIERADVPAMRRRLHLSAQEAARNARHAFLRRVAVETGAERIALAHTQDDRLETILLNLLRGTGLEGLSGFPPVSLPLVRPLYDVRRAQVEAYCAAHALHPRQDSSNANRDYRRNRIRTELLPYLAAYFNEKADAAILRMADLTAADNTVLEGLANEALLRVATRRSEDEVALDVGSLRSLPLALQRRVLRQGIAQVRGHLHDIGQETLERVLEAAARGERRQISLPADEMGTVRLRCDAIELSIARETAPAKALPWQQELTVPGRVQLRPAGMALEARLCRTNAESASLLAAQTVTGPEATRETRPGPLFALFRRSDIHPPLLIRSWRPGDRIRPRGLGGSKKLQDLFTDRKVPAAERARVPIVVDAGGSGPILWVVGQAVAEFALRPEEAAGETVVLRAERGENGPE
ncbi:MAG TPA: tRNA lysidine(34) synthetase TilS [Chthonomonadaceae bacterium]|nr:tRNA lysidine(34) synthetase TilS [Chthonomonadaceae bacterium]